MEVGEKAKRRFGSGPVKERKRYVCFEVNWIGFVSVSVLSLSC